MKYYKKKIQISVILPVHGKFNFLRGSIHSLVTQNFKKIEILIYSDGNSYFFNKKIKSLIKPYSNIRLFISNKKKGIVNALNILINKSRGKYIARMDADDVCTQDRFEKQFMYAEKRSKNFILSSGCFIIDKKSKLIGEHIPSKIDLNLLKIKNPLIHPTLFAHRDIFKKLLYREIFLSEDYDFYYRALLLNFKFEIIKEPLIFYRVYKKKNILNYYLGIISLIYLKKSIADNRLLNIRFLNNLINNRKKKFNKEIYKNHLNFYSKIVIKKKTIATIFLTLILMIKDRYLFELIFNKFKSLLTFSSKNKLKYKKISNEFFSNKKNKIISVIIPTRNSEKTIKKTLLSVLNQDYENLEIIVVDDGSEDNTLNILKEFAHKITLVNLNKKVLAGEARNEGIKKSSGYYIAFCDSDDYWFKNKISEQLRFLTKNNLNAVCCNAISLRNNIRKPCYINFPYSEINFEDLLSKNYIINSSILLKKNILIDSKMYPEKKYFYSYEDYFLWIKISLLDNIGFLDKDLLIYTDNPRYSARHNSLSFYKIKIRILLYFLIKFLFGKFNFNNLLKIIKVYILNLIQFILNIK